MMLLEMMSYTNILIYYIGQVVTKELVNIY